MVSPTLCTHLACVKDIEKLGALKRARAGYGFISPCPAKEKGLLAWVIERGLVWVIER